MIRAFVSSKKPDGQREIACDPGDVYFFWEFAGLYFHGTATYEEAQMLAKRGNASDTTADVHFARAHEALAKIQQSLDRSSDCLTSIGAQLGILQNMVRKPEGNRGPG
jgi:hypothetical protein